MHKRRRPTQPAGHTSLLQFLTMRNNLSGPLSAPYDYLNDGPRRSSTCGKCNDIDPRGSNNPISYTQSVICHQLTAGWSKNTMPRMSESSCSGAMVGTHAPSI